MITIINTRQLLLLFLLVLSYFPSLAQQETMDKQTKKLIDQLYKNAQAPDGYIHCATSPSEMLMHSKDYESREHSFEQYIGGQRSIMENKQLARAAVLEIPIIFHIIHNGQDLGTSSNLSADLINAQLEQLNNDFRKIAGSSGDGGGVDTEIQFTMALVDESGQLLPEPGIHRIDGRTITGAGTEPYSRTLYNSTIKPATQFDPERYLNIWTGGVSAPRGILLGFAQLPEAPDLLGIGTGNGGANTDGCVVNFFSIGSTSMPNPSFRAGPSRLGRTLTHEIGHWLGLRHTGGDGDCSADDFCADTPTAQGNQFGCSFGRDSCPEPGLDPLENYMNFTNDDCMDRFTACQKDRMRIVMGDTGNGSPRRAILASSTVASMAYSRTSSLSMAKTTGTALPSEDITISPNPANDVLFINGLPKGDYTLSILSIEGAEFLRKEVHNEETSYRIELELMNVGVYIIHVTGADLNFRKRILVDR